MRINQNEGVLLRSYVYSLWFPIFLDEGEESYETLFKKVTVDLPVDFKSVVSGKLLKEHGIIQSMSRKGNCWDNAVAESFFHTLKTGLTNHKQYQTRDEAQEDIFEYIEVFYNRRRLHSTNDYWSPVDYEAMQKVV